MVPEYHFEPGTSVEEILVMEKKKILSSYHPILKKHGGFQLKKQSTC